MNRVCRCILAGVVFFLFSSPVHSVILDPGDITLTTVNGSVGLVGLTHNSGSISSSSPTVDFSKSGTLNSDGSFTVEVPTGASYNINSYLYYPGFNFSSNFQGFPALNVGDPVPNHNLLQVTGIVHPNITVVGGTLTYISMSASVYKSGTVSTTESFSTSGGAGRIADADPVLNLPVVVASDVRVSISVTTQNINGCTVSRSVGQQIVTVNAGATTEVDGTVDVSDVTCDEGSIRGEIKTLGLPADVQVSSHNLSFYGPSYKNINLTADGPYLADPMREGNYYIYRSTSFQPPYGSIGYPSEYVTVVAGEETIKDYITLVGTASGQLQTNGSWGLADTNSAGLGGNSDNYQTSAYDRFDPLTGQFNLVLPVGNWNLRSFNFYFYENMGSRYYNSSLNIYDYVSPYLGINVAEGDVLTQANRQLDTAEADVIYDVLQVPGQPLREVGNLRTSGNGLIKDPATGAAQRSVSISADSYGSPSSTITMKIRGIPGDYTFTATAYGTDGLRYTADYTLTLGTPSTTPVGTNVEEVLSDTVVMTFDNVVSAGTTTLSELSIGPQTPEGFVIYGPNQQEPLYFDIVTTAEFTGGVQVCVTYDDSSLTAGQEKRLELGHYVCDANNANCTWDMITDVGYPELANNLLCGTTTSFSIFALMFQDVVDTDGDGIIDDEDNCRLIANEDQADLDGDGIGDACDEDTDGDGFINSEDYCPLLASTENGDLDGDGVGDVCDDDIDGDSVLNIGDNCPLIANTDQLDFDGDTLGNACDTDVDNDGIANGVDVCEYTVLGSIIDSQGCSGSQRFEYYCPLGSEYRNHGEYVTCMQQEAHRQVELSLLDGNQVGMIVSAAAMSDVGKKLHETPPGMEHANEHALQNRAAKRAQDKKGK